jgi:hypothetical protein
MAQVQGGSSMTYLGRGDPVRRLTLFDGREVGRTDYQPVWVNSLADDVILEGSAMNGVVQGAEAVRSIVTYIRTFYDDRSSTSPALTARTASWRITRPGSAASSSATSSSSPATPRGRHSTSWPTTGPGHTAARVPARRRALHRYALRRALRYQRPRVSSIGALHAIQVLCIFLVGTDPWRVDAGCPRRQRHPGRGLCGRGAMVPNGSRKRIAPRRRRSGRRVWARMQPLGRRVYGLVDDGDYGVGTRDQRQMSCLHEGDVRTGAGRHLLLKLRRHNVILGSDQRPRRNGRPGWRAGRLI